MDFLDWLILGKGSWIAYPLAVLFVIGLWMGSSAMEAKAFNRVTGKNVTMWDAMFIQLRVQDEVAK
ncbi:hypothetical protein VN12_02145 [Pirellula sp. SH-Sr6A]|uniref:hypothetical protein n=1 Tax=Pirellula sp. SH-Sr6A TaxID=1632865 RepID=UPI00078B3F6B|nr:hypothetical protein [Pirellula sp. SH-Sr6A]AMV30887.1 hypothetical protein VN12_02145 [Pirellula sp. SH-Sr6A]